LRVAIYAPYLAVSGGGEKYIGKIAEILSKKHDVDFVVLTRPDIEELQRSLHIDLSRIGVKCMRFPNILNSMPRLRSLVAHGPVSRISKEYDLFINQEHFSTIPNSSRWGILICEIPVRKSTGLVQSLIRPVAKLVSDPCIRTYNKIVVNSQYTQRWMTKYYHRTVEVLYPPIDTEAFAPLPLSKENIILSVGRFFVGGHNKKQREMIRIFGEIQEHNEVLREWEYHLVGQVDGDAKAQEYVKICKNEAKNYPVLFHLNAPFHVLQDLYRRAKIFWHATGLDEDETIHPERFEHFGMATVEAMSAGCVPVVINKGGQPEIVRNTIEGLLWNTSEQLKEYTLDLVENDNLMQKMSQLSVRRSQEFNMKVFEGKVEQILVLETSQH